MFRFHPQLAFVLLNIQVREGFPGGASGKESTCQCRGCQRHSFGPWVGKMSWSRERQPAPVSLPGKLRQPFPPGPPVVNTLLTSHPNSLKRPLDIDQEWGEDSLGPHYLMHRGPGALKRGCGLEHPGWLRNSLLFSWPPTLPLRMLGEKIPLSRSSVPSLICWFSTLDWMEWIVFWQLDSLESVIYQHLGCFLLM